MTEISQKGGYRSTNTQNIFNTPSLDIVRSPSIFMSLVSIISSGDYLRENGSSDDYSSYDIDEKIDYNDVIKYRDKIEDYYLYNGMIEQSYVTLNEKSQPLGKGFRSHKLLLQGLRWRNKNQEQRSFKENN